MISVSIVEDDAKFVSLVQLALLQNSGIEVAGIYLSAEEALKEIPKHPPDVILMDISLPGMDGIECLRNLTQFFPLACSHVLMVTGCDNMEQVFESLKAGACGYLLKSQTTVSGIAAKIHDAYNGGAPITPTIARQILTFFKPQPPLLQCVQFLKRNSPERTIDARQSEVLYWIARGLAYKEIVVQLEISIDTVRKHASAIYAKMRVRSRTEATRYYMEHAQDATLRISVKNGQTKEGKSQGQIRKRRSAFQRLPGPSRGFRRWLKVGGGVIGQ
jgi:NarL family two-component system response regulator LiaR